MKGYEMGPIRVDLQATEVAIDVSHGIGSVKLAGVDVSDRIVAVSIDARVGERARVTLELMQMSDVAGVFNDLTRSGERRLGPPWDKGPAVPPVRL